MEIAVIDTGIGIKKEDQSKLFKLFGYIQDSKQKNIHGIGLGLKISKKIIEQFDGEVGLTSELDKGSTFKFVLKLFNCEESTNRTISLNIKDDDSRNKKELNKIPSIYEANNDKFVFKWMSKRPLA